MNLRPVKCGLIIGSAFVLGMLVFCSAHLFAKEETAHLTFERGKVSKKDTYSRTIKRGDTLYSLVSSVYEPRSGRTRKQIYDAIKQLNPRLRSIHVIYAGQKMRLPKKHLFPGGRAATITGKTTGPEKVEVPPQDPPLPTSDYRMAVIREVITRMNGALSTTGNYYIPLPQSGQISIDCTRIPVVELADGSVILLDFSQRMSASLKKIIPEYWPNYHLVAVSLREESPRILQKMMTASKVYAMTKIQKPVEVGKVPQLQIAQGWLITEKSADGEKKALQLITFLKDRQHLLPKAFIAEAKRNGLVITEVIEGHGVVDPPAIRHPALSIPDLRSSTHMDLIVNLLNIFNLQPSRNTDVKIFEQSRDGFNLSVKADLMIRQGNKRAMFHAKPLPSQFTDILRENGVEPILLKQEDSRRTTIEKTLVGLGVSFSSNVFSFSVPQEADKPSGVIRFPAIRAAVNKSSQYLIEFDMDQNLYQLLHRQWGVNLMKY
ncbi:MAG: LysM peptidoglycan-binding domain-containing protein [Syntrophales bacterium]|nr:LysM peptidoglycan-binding domain-containing protein [Syntrophales bacterium]